MKYDTKKFAPAHFVQVIIREVQLAVCQQNMRHQTSSRYRDQEVYTYYVQAQIVQYKHSLTSYLTSFLCVTLHHRFQMLPRHCVMVGCDTKVEQATVYVDFQRQGATKQMVRGQEVTGTVHYRVHGFPKHLKDHCFIAEGVCYRSKGHRNF